MAAADLSAFDARYPDVAIELQTGTTLALRPKPVAAAEVA